MAAVIHYLSADNHTADIIPFKPVITELISWTWNRQVSALHFCRNSVTSIYVFVHGYVKVLQSSFSSGFSPYLYIRCLNLHILYNKNRISCQWKTKTQWGIHVSHTDKTSKYNIATT